MSIPKGRLFLAFFIVSVCMLASAEEKKPTKPTGACTITVYGIPPTCVSAMTKDSCDAAAEKVKGVAEWKEGKTCPKVTRKD